MINRLLLLITLGLLTQTATAFPITSYLEMVKVSMVGSAWTPVPLSNLYTHPVIACTYNLPAVTDNEAVVRVRSDGANGFEVFAQQPSGNVITPGDIYCTISETGAYTYPIKYEARTIDSAGTNYSQDWTDAPMEDISVPPYKTQSYIQPVVTGQVMSFNNTGFSAFWSGNCSSRKTPPGNAAICIGKHTGMITPNLPNPETLGYFIAEEAEYFMAHAYLKIELGGNSIRGVGSDAAPYTYPLPRSFSHATATQSAMNGGNGGWGVLYGSTPVSTTLNLAIDEETVANASGRAHTAEEVAYWVAEPINKTIADLTINEIMYQQATGFPEFIELYAQTSGSIVNYVISSQDGATQNYLLPDIDVVAGDYIVFYIHDTGTDSSVGNVHTVYSRTNGGPKLADTGDDIVLLKPSATDVTALNGSGIVNAIPVDYVAYSAGSTDPVPVSNEGVTVNWNPANVSNLKDAAGGQSISLTRNALDSDTSLCWELTASGQAASCPGYIITSDTDPGAYINSAGENNNFSPLLTLEKTVQTLYDPVNHDTNPKAIPGSILEYTITAYNGGPAPADNNSITITDLIPANTRLCVTTVGFCTPPYFTDGSPSSGLSAGAVGYSIDGGSTYSNLPPAPDGFGASNSVTHISMPTSGAFQPISGNVASNFSVKFRVIVE